MQERATGWVSAKVAAAGVLTCWVLFASTSAPPARACSPLQTFYSARPAAGATLPTGIVQLVLVSSGGEATSPAIAVTTGAGVPIAFGFVTVTNGILVSFDTTGVSDVAVYAQNGSSAASLAHIASYTVGDVPQGVAPTAPHVAPGESYCDTCSGGETACCFRSGVLNTPVDISGDGVVAAWVDASGRIAGVVPYGTAYTTSTGVQVRRYVPASRALVSLDVFGRQSAPTEWSTAAPTACGGETETGSESPGACQATAGARSPTAWSGALLLAVACFGRRRMLRGQS